MQLHYTLIEFCGSLGINAKIVQSKHTQQIDATDWLMRLDREEDIQKRLDIGFEFLSVYNNK